MGSASDYLEKKLQDHWLGGGDYVRPATVYVALYSVAPTDAGGGTELSGNGYARKAVTNNAANFPAASGVNATKTNANNIEFDPFTGGTQTVVAYALLDAASGGNLLFTFDVTTAKTYGTGDVVRIPVGGMVIEVD